MTISQLQASQAIIFLAAYNDAISALKQTAYNDKMKNNYQQFLNAVIDWRSRKTQLNQDLMRKITMFQYSHYFYLKKMKDLSSYNINQINFQQFYNAMKKAVS